MTPQEIDTREERGDDRLSTSDLAAAIGTHGGSAPAMAKAAPEPNLPLFGQNDTQDFRSRWEKIHRQCFDRRPPRRPPPVPVLLRPALVCLASISRSKVSD
jgi:hypothetical protein